MRGVPVVVIALASVAEAQVATVRGKVIDRTSKAPVAGALIAVGNELAASDDDGAFTIALPPGRYTLEVSAPFLVTKRAMLQLSGDRVLVLEVDAADEAKGERIEIVDIAPTAPGETRVDARLARTVPGGGDAVKVVQSLPAVARPPTGSSEIVVWGAAPRDTRVFVDGVPVPTLYHLGGYRASVGNDLVGDIRLTPAAFGPDRGRAIGGVIDIGLADPASAPTWRAQADFLDGAIAAKADVGPVTVAAAVRTSWLDRAIGAVSDPRELAPNAPVPRWLDGQIVARTKLAKRVVLSGWVLTSVDSLDRTLVSDDPATEVHEQVDQRWVRAMVSLRRDRDDGFDGATLWFGRDRASDAFMFGLTPANSARAQWVGGARGVQQLRLAEQATLTVGVDLDAERAHLERLGSLTIPAREGDLRIYGQPPGDDVSADAWTSTTLDAAGHAALDLRVGRITATLAGRLDAWMLDASRLLPRVGMAPGIGTQTITYTADPRGSVQVRLTDEAIARVDAGRYHQARAASDASAVFGTPQLGLEHAWHITAGGQWRRAPFAIEAAGYARWLDDLVARDPAVTPPLGATLTQAGSGRVIGVQITGRVVGWRGLTGWLSYNISESTRRDSDMQTERLFDRDQTHGLVAVGGWERGPWTLGGRVRMATGEPRTDVIGSFFDTQSGRYQPIRGTHNGVRLPAYFAADVRGERRLRLGDVRTAVYLEVQNLTNRANAEEIIYSADFSERAYLTSLPLLAIAGLRIER
ncbi:MAG: TonB-dependent receptor [Kofleriaceae bacterium]|nr:TonB-dependent receptor [Kofleriaceae bacterium]